ncbi:alpha/beta hydrolase family protein [Amycolatopsis orientalis]|uniref:alpha/beta hydrolase family protein n=1 Tax=Amycolatopsis orientalis TaxID=31958 RepID=UPI0003AA9551|nr:alpha/beta hydrolase [Amycolatopsis orientalis]
MLQYFRDYPANLALSMALDMGANMAEIDRACRDLRDHGAGPGLAEAFFEAWAGAGDRLVRAAEADEAAGRRYSAAEKYRRATVMYLTGERMPEHDNPARIAVYDRLLATFGKYVELGEVNCQRVAVPYQGSVLPALWVPASEAEAPAVVHFNGLDGTKEFLFLSGFGTALNRRGVSVLFVDNPGVGEALRKHGLHNFAEAEIPAGACVDYLEERPDVDADRIGMVALSLGGHHAARATAFEPRFKLGVCWGANYDFAARLRARVSGSGAQPSVPHLVKHLMWVFGTNSMEECLEATRNFHLRGILDRITQPILITHGEEDQQIPVSEAWSTYEGCVNSSRRELRRFTADEGGEQHCQIGTMSLGTDFMADWIAEVLVKP